MNEYTKLLEKEIRAKDEKIYKFCSQIGEASAIIKALLTQEGDIEREVNTQIAQKWLDKISK